MAQIRESGISESALPGEDAVVEPWPPADGEQVDARGVSPDTAGMAYDEALAERIREVIEAEPGLSEKHMFGGLAFLVHGNMAFSASSHGGLLLRIDPADAESLVTHEHVRRFEMRGREMDGWLHVDAKALETHDELVHWVGYGLTYARSLAPKQSIVEGPPR